MNDAPSLLTIFLVVAAVWCLPVVAVCGWVVADRIMDRLEDMYWERRNGAPDVPVDPAGDLTYQQLCFERWEADL